MRQPMTAGAVFLVLLPLMAALNLAYLWVQVHNPADTSMPESLQVYCAQRVAQGRTLYQDYYQPPYNYMPYTPLYFWIVGTIAGSVKLPLSGIFLLGRLLTLVCCLGIALLLYLRHRGEHDGLLLTASGSFLFLGSTILWQWGSTTRPDIASILLSLAGLMLYARFSAGPTRWLSMLLFLLAFLTKQSAVNAPAAVVLFELLNKRYRQAILVAVIFPVLAAGAMATMHFDTGGLSTLDIVENNAAPMQLLNIKLIGVPFLQSAALPLILAFVATSMKGRTSLESIYFLLSLGLAVVASAKLGSNLNYYLEPLAAACLLVPSGISAVAAMPKGNVLLVSLLLILLLPPLSFTVYSLQNPGFRTEARIHTLAEEPDGPILTDSPRLALISRKQFFIDPFSLSYLEQQGKWDSRGVVAMLDRHEIELVILTMPIEKSSSWQGAKRLPAPVIEAVRRNFDFEKIVDGYSIYLPRK